MEEQGLVVVKDDFLSKITNRLKRFFFKDKTKDLLLKEESPSEQDVIKTRFIDGNREFVQLEILDARRAYRKYVINNNRNISRDVLSYVIDKVKENETEIRQIIEINKDDITYDDILNMLENEKKSISKYKSKDLKTGCYNVPVGVIGVECTNSKDAIKNIFKSISTRNAIMIMHDKYSKYSTEALILLIVKECLKNFYIDDNIIQMFEKGEIDLTKLDKLIKKDGNTIDKETSNSIYIYQENDEYEEDVKNEIKRLQSTDIFKSYNIKPIKGEFGNVINYLNNQKEAPAICMYTNNTQKAYKFINWINSPNVFINTGIRKCNKSLECLSDFHNLKYVLHEDVF